MGLYDFFASAYPELMAAIGDYTTEGGQTEQNLKAVKDALKDASDAWKVYAKAKQKAAEEEIDEDEAQNIVAKLAKATNAAGLKAIFSSTELTDAEREWAQNNLKIIDELMLGQIPSMESWKQLKMWAVGALDLSDELAKKNADSAFDELKDSGYLDWISEIS